MRKGRTRKSKGWWRRGDVGAYQNAGNMTCWAHRELAAVDEETRNNMEAAWEAEDDKDECIVNLEGPEQNYWLGSEAGMLGCYWFSGVVFAGDGSDHRGRMGAGAYCLGDPDVQQCVGVGREEEGTSSNRPELAALVLALRKTRFTDNLLYLCDNQSLLKAVQKWTGEGPKQTMANAPDADILREIIELLKMRVQNGAATFLVKVKAHRGEPLNELADSLAEAAREVGMEKKEWCDRTERMVFKWKDKDQERSSVWTAGVRNAIRKGVGRSVVKQVKSKAADKWRRAHMERGEGCDRHKKRTQTWMQPTQEGMEEVGRGVGSEDIRKEEWWNDQCGEGMRKLHEDLPATTTWEAEFLLREGLSREVTGKWMANEAVPWKRRRRWLQTIAGIFPCGKWLHKIRKRPDDLCARCAKVGKKHVETVAHLQSVQCVSPVDAVTAAHNRCWNVIMDGIVKHGSERRDVQPITCGKEKTFRTIWREAELEEFFPQEQVEREERRRRQARKAREEEARQEEREGREEHEEEEEKMEEEEKSMWDRRADGVAIDRGKKILYLLEFKRTSDQRADFEKKATVRAEQQYEDVVGALTEVGRDMGRQWKVKLLTFVVCTCGSVHKDHLEKNLEELQVLKSKWNGIREKLVRRLLEEQDKVFRCYYAAKWGGQKEKGAGGEETGQMHVGGEVYVTCRDMSRK